MNIAEWLQVIGTGVIIIMLWEIRKIFQSLHDVVEQDTIESELEQDSEE